jgi:hypothetical protein
VGDTGTYKSSNAERQMAGGEQHTSLQGFDGGVGTVGIFEV